MARIKVGVKPVGKPLHAEWVTNDLKSLQNIVGGNIELFRVTEDLGIICNEEGRINGMRYNCKLCGQQFFGNIAFVGIAGEEFTDCADIKLLKIIFGEV